MGPQAHNNHYDSILFQNTETMLIYSWNSKVVYVLELYYSAVTVTIDSY